MAGFELAVHKKLLAGIDLKSEDVIVAWDGTRDPMSLGQLLALRGISVNACNDRILFIETQANLTLPLSQAGDHTKSDFTGAHLTLEPDPCEDRNQFIDPALDSAEEIVAVWVKLHTGRLATRAISLTFAFYSELGGADCSLFLT
jgi:hypothetical protein